jgi:hypothetical protein
MIRSENLGDCPSAGIGEITGKQAPPSPVDRLGVHTAGSSVHRITLGLFGSEADLHHQVRERSPCPRRTSPAVRTAARRAGGHGATQPDRRHEPRKGARALLPLGVAPRRTPPGAPRLRTPAAAVAERAPRGRPRRAARRGGPGGGTGGHRLRRTTRPAGRGHRAPRRRPADDLPARPAIGTARSDGEWGRGDRRRAGRPRALPRRLPALGPAPRAPVSRPAAPAGPRPGQAAPIQAITLTLRTGNPSPPRGCGRHGRGRTPDITAHISSRTRCRTTERSGRRPDGTDDRQPSPPGNPPAPSTRSPRSSP